MERKEMMGTEIIREIMRRNGVTQQVLADRLGYRSNSAVTGRLSTLHISAEKLVEMLGALGYEVIVRKIEMDGTEEDGMEWKVIG